MQAVLVLLVWAALIGSAGLARATRRALIAFARRLLRVPLPAPAAAPSGADRWRTPLWLLLHVALGWAGALTSGVLVLMGITLPGGRLDAEAGLSLFGRSLRSDGGWRSWVPGLCCLLLAAVVCVVVTSVLRWLAPRLVGPSSAGRLALMAEREQRLAAGEAILFPATLRRMVAARPLGSAEALPRAALTEGEEEVLRLMATGLSNPEIAQLLMVSLETVKTHVGNVLTKLGAQNRTHAVVIAYESGLVVPGFTG
ncbi:response regulator transcription factor [Streptomyces stramineus]|uniref:helix-turn-helix transcriptional regulator n=1 Tax=Streptomyces stramineus TaxID=173861 RepID=UPI0031D5E6C3